MRRSLKRLALAVVLAFAPACSSPTTPTATPTPTPSPTLVSVVLGAVLTALNRVGATTQVIAKGTFSNGGSQDITTTCVNWQTDNHGVATISQDGVLTAQGSGTTTVTVMCQGIFATGLATLTPPAANLVVIGTLHAQGCDQVSVDAQFQCASFTGLMQNTGSGCAANIRGTTTTSLTSTGAQIGSASWSYGPTVKPGDQFSYSGGPILVGVVGTWSYWTSMSWDSVFCSSSLAGRR
jgi:hypothetical protein